MPAGFFVSGPGDVHSAAAFGRPAGHAAPDSPPRRDSPSGGPEPTDTAPRAVSGLPYKRGRMSDQDPATLADAVAAAAKKVEEAQAAYDEAAAAERAASSRETQARNNLNNAQKAFDAAVSKLREAAPRQSDWSENKVRQFAAA